MTEKIEYERIYLRKLCEEDASESYVSWLNDPVVNQYLDNVCRENHTVESVREFIKNLNTKGEEILFGIFLKNSDKHIGNIKIGPINQMHKLADVGFIIGDKSEWGKGYAAEAIKAVTVYSFDSLRLNKLSAGLYASNVQSARTLEKAGFKKEGHRIKHYILKGEPHDIIEYGVCNDG